MLDTFWKQQSGSIRLQRHNDRAQHAGHRTKQAKQEEKRSSHMVAARIWYLINNAVGHHMSTEQSLDIRDPELGNALSRCRFFVFIFIYIFSSCLHRYVYCISITYILRFIVNGLSLIAWREYQSY